MPMPIDTPDPLPGLPPFPFIPDATGYQLTAGNEIRATSIPGGLPRIRRDFDGAPSQTTVQWSLNPTTYNVAMAFWRAACKKGSQPFQCLLVVDSAALAWYVCQFVPATFGLTSQKGNSYVLGATLMVQSTLADSDLDSSLLATYGVYGDTTSNVLISIAELANNVADLL